MEHIARSPGQIGAIVQRIRKARNLTQAALGEKVGLRQATVSRLEAGEVATRLETLIAALTALELELVIRPRGGAEGIAADDNGAGNSGDDA